jgi:hypothetical protein
MSKEYAEIEAKHKRGETLTADEVKEVMSMPNQDETYTVPEGEDEDPFANMENEAGDTIDADGKPAAPAKAEKPAATPEAVATPKGEDDISDILIELEKPDGSADLSNFSNHKKSLYWDLRRERSKRQDLERQNAELQLKIMQTGKKEEVSDPKEDEIEGDDNDIVTKADLKKALAAKKEAKANEALKEDGEKSFFRQQYLHVCEQVAREKYSDYDEVLECAPEIAKSNPAYVQEVLKTIQSGENAAIKVYNLIKADPKFPEIIPLGKARVAARPKSQTAPKADVLVPKEAPDQVKKAEAKIVENEKKTKTSGNFTGSSEDSSGDKYTVDDIAKMSTLQWARLPKKERDYYFNKYAK